MACAPTRTNSGLTMGQVIQVRLAAEGLTDAEIAQRLHIAAATVRNKWRLMREQTGLRTRTELAVLGWREGWLR